MRKKFIIFLSLLCFLCHKDVCASDSTRGSDKHNWKYYFNPGISVGYAGSRPNIPIPQLVLRSAKVYGHFMMIPGKRTSVKSYELGVDVFNLMSGSGLIHRFGMSGGYSSYQRDPEFFRQIENYVLLVNYATFKPGKRVEWSLKAGLAYHQQFNTATNVYVDQKITPWAGVSINLHAFPHQIPKPVWDRDSSKRVPSVYATNSFLSRAFNPSVGIGIGGGYGGVYGLAYQFNIASVYIKLGHTIMVNPFPISDATSIQVGLNFYQFQLIPGFATYGTVSSDFTVQRYNCGSADDVNFCEEDFNRGSLLFGINSFKYNSRISWTAKVGLGWRTGRGEHRTFDKESISYPSGEIGVQIHLFKFREAAFQGKLVWQPTPSHNEKKKIELKQERQDSVRLRDVLNIYASLGAGIGHPDFYGPTIGITLWRLSFSGGLIPARGNWSTAFSGELELGNFTPLLSMSAGSSVLKWSENETLTSIFLGLTRKTGHRFSVSIKAGAAIYEEYFSNRWYPAGDISLRINAFKHSG